MAGDLAWAFEWKDRVILPGESLVLSEDNLIGTVEAPIPEPASLSLLGLALLAIKRRRV